MPDKIVKILRYYEDGKWHKKFVILERIPGTLEYRIVKEGSDE